jgi:hypothetical protein
MLSWRDFDFELNFALGGSGMVVGEVLEWKTTVRIHAQIVEWIVHLRPCRSLVVISSSLECPPASSDSCEIRLLFPS